jgi:hypothetical protein
MSILKRFFIAFVKYSQIKKAVKAHSLSINKIRLQIYALRFLNRANAPKPSRSTVAGSGTCV